MPDKRPLTSEEVVAVRQAERNRWRRLWVLVGIRFAVTIFFIGVALSFDSAWWYLPAAYMGWSLFWQGRVLRRAYIDWSRSFEADLGEGLVEQQDDRIVDRIVFPLPFVRRRVLLQTSAYEILRSTAQSAALAPGTPVTVEFLPRTKLVLAIRKRKLAA